MSQVTEGQEGVVRSSVHEVKSVDNTNASNRDEANSSHSKKVSSSTVDGVPVVHKSDFIAQRFVSQYFNVLGNEPHRVHRFYSKLSVFSCVDDDESSDVNAKTSNIVGQDNISHTLKILGFKQCQVEIESTNHQDSVDNSILVLVTGLISNKGLPVRRFVQSVVLVPQEVGFYVRNGYMQFLKSNNDVPIMLAPIPSAPVATSTTHTSTSTNTMNTDAVQENSTTIMKDSRLKDDSVVEPETVEGNQQSMSEVSTETVSVSHTENRSTEQTPIKISTNNQKQTMVESVAPVTAPNASWATHLFSTPSWSKNATRHDVEAIVSSDSQPCEPASTRLNNNADVSDESSMQNRKSKTQINKSSGNVQSSNDTMRPRAAPACIPNQLFVSNIPSTATTESLKTLFAQFGNVVRVDIHERRNFGFVVFEAVDGVTATLQSGAIEIDGQNIKVEPRKGKRQFGEYRGNFRGRHRGRGHRGHRGHRGAVVVHHSDTLSSSEQRSEL